MFILILDYCVPHFGTVELRQHRLACWRNQSNMTLTQKNEIPRVTKNAIKIGPDEGVEAARLKGVKRAFHFAPRGTEGI
jgi:hypothetical protein